jgi:hypothetical protein
MYIKELCIEEQLNPTFCVWYEIDHISGFKTDSCLKIIHLHEINAVLRIKYDSYCSFCVGLEFVVS